VVEETPMKANKFQAGSPKLVQSTEKGARPNKLQAPAEFKFYAQLTTPFDLFFESFVPKYRAENSTMEKSKLKQNVLIGLARQMWDNDMGPQNKVEYNSKFVEMCEAQKLDFVWEQDEADESKKRKKGDSSGDGKDGKKKKGAPKPLSGWMTFLAEFRLTNTGGSIGETTKAAGPVWKTKTKEEKQEYTRKGIEIFEAQQAGGGKPEEDEEASDAEMSGESEEEQEEDDASEEEGQSRKRKVHSPSCSSCC
jgi:hypothetical protein